MADHTGSPEVTGKGLEGGLGARFRPDHPVAYGDPLSARKSYQWSLPADIATRLQSPEVFPERSLFLFCALRILHFRHSEVETASIVAHNLDGSSSTCQLSIRLNEDMSIEQAVELSRASLAVAKSSEPSEHSPSSNPTCFQYSGDEECPVSCDGDFAMIWYFCETSKCRVDYDGMQYRPQTLELLTLSFVDVLSAVLNHSRALVVEVDFPHALEQLHCLGDPLDPPSEPTLPEGLVDALGDTVAKHGSELAVAQGSFVPTYLELDNLSSRLAQNIIIQAGPNYQPGGIIAFCIPPSGLAIVTILAIMKAGCAYIPIDVRHPPGRVLDILENSKNPCLVISAESPHFLSSSDFKASMIDVTGFLNNWKSLCLAEQYGNPNIPVYSKLACLLYTSGTTGVPKGVRTKQKSILALASLKDAIPFQPGDRVSQVTNLAWDAHILEIWVPLLRGATVCIFNRFDVLDPPLLSGLFNALGITSSFLPPAMFRHILGKSPELLKPLKHLLIGGEPARYEDYVKARAANPELTIQNIYGPTECCVFTTFDAPTKLSSQFPATGAVPIGRPLSITQVVILDAHGRLVPPGISGEMYIRGHNIADGYENRDQETRAAFIEKQIPGVNESPCIFYRTGDKARWKFDGQLEFQGRLNSNQIKVRGQRFELTEVEANIIRATRMRDVVVAYHKPEGQSTGALVGYMVPLPDSEHWRSMETDESVLVETWEEHYDVSYSEDDIVKIRKEFIGWDSMITGQPIPHNEMKDWLDDTLRPFFLHRPQNVLEVGCGIGIIVYEMIPFVKHFYGIEPSGSGVQQLQVQLRQDGFGEKASLWHAHADQIQTLPDFNVDFVLINSVVQYFPSLHYLNGVISKCIGRCRPGSQIVLGDVRSAPLNDLLAIDILISQWSDCLAEKSVHDLRREVHKKQQYATELLVDPTFFFELQQRDSRITHVEIIPKIFPYSNELSRYRYQVVLHVQTQLSLVNPTTWVSPDKDDPYLASLPQLLKEFVFSDRALLAVEQIPNRFLIGVVKRLQTLRAPSTHQLASLTDFSCLDTQSTGWSASDLKELAALYGLSVQLSCARQAESGILDAVFTKSSAPDQRAIFPQNHRPWSSVKLNPEEEALYKRKKLDDQSFQSIADTLKTTIPDFMVPEDLYIIDQIPLTKNGKIDRSVLAIIAASDYGLKLQRGPRIHGYRSETEHIICNLFADFLGTGSSISPSTDFFKNGGHSLLATRLRSALQEKFQVGVSVKQIFDTPTPKQLAAEITKLQKTAAPLLPQINATTHSGPLADLSYAQFRLWFLEMLNPMDSWYISGFVLLFERRLDEDVLERTLTEISMRHDVLRTLYIEQDGVPKQMVTDQKPHLEKVDIVDVDDKDKVKSIVREYMMRPFDLSCQVPVRPVLFRWGEQHILLMALHHIVTDGFSHDIWRTELESIYLAFLAGKPSPLPALPIQYKDYAIWQHSEEHQRLIGQQLEYLIPHLKGSRPARLPIDFVRMSPQSEAGTSIVTCDKSLKESLEIICRENHVTWFMLLIAVFRALQFQWTGQSDASLGNPIANRHRSELECLMGFFVNTQVLRLKCQKGMPFLDLLRQTRESTLKAFENQDVPFDKLVEVLQPPRSALQNPLVQIMFAFQTSKTAPFSLGDIPVSNFGIDQLTTRFDLEVHWSERPDLLRCVMFYRLDVFKPSTIDKFGNELLEFLGTIAKNPNTVLVSDHEESETIELEFDSWLPEVVNSADGPDGPPQNETEQEICLVFESVLGHTAITRQSNFFYCGGHSLLVTLACSKLRKAFHGELKISDIFAYPTPAALANRIYTLIDAKEGQTSSKDSTVSESLEHSTEPSEPEVSTYHVFKTLPGKPLLFCLPMATGVGTMFASLAMAADDFSVVALNDPFLIGDGLTSEKSPSSSTLNEIAEIYYRQIVHLEGIINGDQSTGGKDSEPLTLNILGYSFGGNVAIEVARQARRDERNVNLFVVDSADAGIPSAEGLAQKITTTIPTEEIEAIIQAALGEASKAVVNKALSSVTDAGESKGLGPAEAVPQSDSLARIRECAEANIRRLFNHKMAIYPGHATMFRSEANSLHGLYDKVESLEEVVLQGNHYELFDYSKEQLEVIIGKISKGIRNR